MLKKLTQQATDLILHSIASGEVMGANFLITKGNEELVYAQAGMADREAEKPIERNTIFRLYSMTKPVTAVAAMILMERGSGYPSGICTPESGARRKIVYTGEADTDA